MKTTKTKTASIITILFGLIAMVAYSIGAFVFYITLGLGESLSGSALWEIRIIFGLDCLMMILSLIIVIISIMILVQLKRDPVKLYTKRVSLVTILSMLLTEIIVGVSLGVFVNSIMILVGSAIYAGINLLSFV